MRTDCLDFFVHFTSAGLGTGLVGFGRFNHIIIADSSLLCKVTNPDCGVKRCPAWTPVVLAGLFTPAQSWPWMNSGSMTWPWISPPCASNSCIIPAPDPREGGIDWNPELHYKHCIGRLASVEYQIKSDNNTFFPFTLWAFIFKSGKTDAEIRWLIQCHSSSKYQSK